MGYIIAAIASRDCCGLRLTATDAYDPYAIQEAAVPGAWPPPPSLQTWQGEPTEKPPTWPGQLQQQSTVWPPPEQQQSMGDTPSPEPAAGPVWPPTQHEWPPRTDAPTDDTTADQQPTWTQVNGEWRRRNDSTTGEPSEQRQQTWPPRDAGTRDKTQQPLWMPPNDTSG